MLSRPSSCAWADRQRYCSECLLQLEKCSFMKTGFLRFLHCWKGRLPQSAFHCTLCTCKAHSGGMQEWVIQIPSIPIIVSVLFPSRIKILLLVCIVFMRMRTKPHPHRQSSAVAKVHTFCGRPHISSKHCGKRNDFGWCGLSAQLIIVGRRGEEILVAITTSTAVCYGHACACQLVIFTLCSC